MQWDVIRDMLESTTSHLMILPSFKFQWQNWNWKS